MVIIYKIYENCELGFFGCLLNSIPPIFSDFHHPYPTLPHSTHPHPTTVYLKIYPMGTGWPQCEGIIYLHPFK